MLHEMFLGVKPEWSQQVTSGSLVLRFGELMLKMNLAESD